MHKLFLKNPIINNETLPIHDYFIFQNIYTKFVKLYRLSLEK